MLAREKRFVIECAGVAEITCWAGTQEGFHAIACSKNYVRDRSSGAVPDTSIGIGGISGDDAIGCGIRVGGIARVAGSGRDLLRIALLALVEKITDAQAARHGTPDSGCLDLVEIKLISQAPRQTQRIGTQAPAPAQWLLEIDLLCSNLAGDMVSGHGQWRDLHRRSSEQAPGEQCGYSREGDMPAEKQQKPCEQQKRRGKKANNESVSDAGS